MKKMLLLAALVMTAMSAMAANVDVMTAQSKATDFLRNKTANGRFMASAPTVKWVHEVKNSSDVSLTAFYVVNTDKGYVVVAGDDRGREILAYGDGSLTDMNDIPDNMQFFLDMYKAELEYLQAHPGMVVPKYSATRGNISVQPMLTTLWQQGTTDGRSPYNRLCPQKGGMTCLVGCAAVSLAQVMNFWEYPESSPALPGYTGGRGVEVSALPAYTFDWANMRDSYKNDNWSEAERDAISNLMRYVGQAEYMDYGTDVSGADEDQMMLAIRTFGYDSGVHYLLKNDYDSAMTELVNDEDWINTMQAELIAGRPLMYCAGAAMSTGDSFYGHAFNVDGYDADNDTYHVNFGQTESHNGYYAFNAFGYGISIYKYFQLMFVGMKPPTGPVPPRMIVNPLYLVMESYAGESTTATFTVAGLDLTDGITVTVNDPNGVFTTDVATIGIDEAGNKTVTVTYAPLTVGEHEASVTLSSAGAADVTVPLYGVATEAPLVLIDPVMQPADSAYITLTSFRADWTDQTPAQNVTSYTLEVSTKPNYVLMAEADWSTIGQNYNDISSTPELVFSDGWTFNGSGLWMEGGCISIRSGASFSTPTMDLTGHDKVTVVISGKGLYSTSGITVSTTQASQAVSMTSGAFNQYVVVLDCAASDNVTILGTSSFPAFKSIQIYAGEVDAPQLRASESGDATYRLITGITDKYYTVNGLTEAGTFLYKVKANYVDGTESKWSNIQEVTLFGTDHGYDPGDVDHNYEVTISDVTLLLNYLLTGEGDVCITCADLSGDGEIAIGDVTLLINKLLTGE